MSRCAISSRSSHWRSGCHHHPPGEDDDYYPYEEKLGAFFILDGRDEWERFTDRVQMRELWKWNRCQILEVWNTYFGGCAGEPWAETALAHVEIFVAGTYELEVLAKHYFNEQNQLHFEWEAYGSVGGVN